MAKRKKAKAKPLSTKVQEAQHRKAYYKKLVEMAHAIGVEDFELLVNADLIRRMFEFRVSTASLTAVTPDIPMAALKSIRDNLEGCFNEFRFCFYEDGPAVSLRDFLSTGHTLYYFLKTKHNPPLPTVLVQKFENYIREMEDTPFSMSKIGEYQWLAALDESTLDGRMYWVNHEYAIRDARLLNRFELHAIRPEQKKIKIKGIARHVLRVGLAKPNGGPEWTSMDSCLFDDQQTPGQRILPVYIQSHALHRMRERLDCFKGSLQHFYLCVSLTEAEVIRTRKGRCLIEYRYQEQKVGYLVADMVEEDMIVIRTFLFVTMDSTPEGKALQQAIGLEAVDKKYLAIDRLSTFLLSDIAGHPDIKQHFINAGCGDLFNFDTSALRPEDQVELAHFIRAYLDKERTSTPAMVVTEEEGIQETAA